MGKWNLIAHAVSSITNISTNIVMMGIALLNGLMGVAVQVRVHFPNGLHIDHMPHDTLVKS